MPTYKDEKTGLWYCKFVYMDWTGQRKQKKKMGFRLQKEAKQFEIDFLSKTAKNCDMSFGSMVDIYMEDCKARLKPTTYQGKEAVIAKHILPYPSCTFRVLRAKRNPENPHKYRAFGIVATTPTRQSLINFV